MTQKGDAARVLRRFFVAPAVLDREPVTFAPREAHHIARVLRLRAGTHIVVFDGAREAEAELVTTEGETVTARRLQTPCASRRPVEITLLQGLPRGPKMDRIVRMGTEVGLAVIAPVLTARALPDAGATRVERWRKIAQEAARQCGRGDVPEIRVPAPLEAALATMGPVDVFVVPWEEEARAIGEMIVGCAFTTAAVLIGPEGGLTANDVACARNAGGETVSLGPLILRTETAGAVTAAMLFYERLLRTGRD